MSDDLLLISGEFLDVKLPPDKEWLLRHFESDVLKAFVVYYVTFDLTKHTSFRYYGRLFVDHTGYQCTRQLLEYGVKRLKKLLADAEKAEKEKDFETLMRLKFNEKDR